MPDIRTFYNMKRIAIKPYLFQTIDVTVLQHCEVKKQTNTEGHAGQQLLKAYMIPSKFLGKSQ